VAALHHYASQQHRNYANEEYTRNLARTHGIESGRALAKLFEVLPLDPVNAGGNRGFTQTSVNRS
jgi:hypothetical protein